MKNTSSKSVAAASEPKVPTDLRKVLSSDSSVMVMWKDVTPIARRDWIRWIESAKLPKTRTHRLETLGSRLASGKRRPCCFAVVPLKLYSALDKDPKAKVQWKSLTPDGRRDFVDWIEAAQDSETKKLRIEKACVMLAAGKSRP